MGNSSLRMTGTCRPAVKGKTHIQSISCPFLGILRGESLFNFPEIKCHFTLNAQMEDNAITNQFQGQRRRESNDGYKNLDKFLLKLKKLPISSKKLHFETYI